MNDDWHTKNEALRTLTAKRVNGALLAFNPGVKMEWEARRMMMATVLGVGEAEIDRAIEELKRVGLVTIGWIQ